MSNEPRPAPEPNDARATVPLPAAGPSTAPDAERSTLPLPGNTPTPAEPVLPEKIGRFEVRSWLGSGAFGDVYRAHDPQLDREVALKVAKPGTLDTPERVSRFLREAKAAANLRHPNIVPLYETGRDGDRLFIAAAFIPGRTLEAVIQEANEKGEPIPLDTAARIIRKLADALAYAHSQGVVHRDVKPANVIIDNKGEPLLLDFGLASRAQAGDERLTTDGQGMGTPAYMAPEQADGHGTAASDQYSLGCAFYELVTGQTPFGGGPAQQIFLHKSQPMPSPRKLCRDVPRDLDTVILKCVEKEPARRYASCGELSEDLRRFLDSEPVKARRIGPVERLVRWVRRKPTAAATVGFSSLAVVLGLVLFVIFGFWRDAEGAKKEAESARDGEKEARGKLEIVNGQLEVAFTGERTARQGEEAAKNDLARLTYNRSIDLAYRRLKEGDPDRAAELLESSPQTLRNWEWRYLIRLCRPEARNFAGLRRAVKSLAFSPDGKDLLAGEEEGDVKVWAIETGQPKLTIPYGSSAGSLVAYHPKGIALLTAGYAGIQFVDHVKGSRRERIAAGYVHQASYNPDGTVLLTVGRANNLSGRWEVRTWNTTTGSEISTIIAVDVHPSSPGFRAAWSKDGQRILTWEPYSEKIETWDANSGKLVATSPELGTARDRPHALAITPDGRQFFGWQEGALRGWHVVTGNQLVIAKPTPPTPPVEGAFSSSGRWLLTRHKSEVRLWAANTGRLLRAVSITGGVSCLAWRMDEGAIAVGCLDGTVKVIDPVFDGNEAEAGVWISDQSMTAISPDGTWAAVPGVQFPPKIRDWQTRRVVVLANGHEPLPPAPGDRGPRIRASPIAFTPDGDLVATGGADKTVRVWKTRTGELLKTFRFGLDPANISSGSGSFNSTGTRLVTSDHAGRVQSLDVAAGMLVWQREVPNTVFSVAFNPDGSRLATGGRGWGPQLWDAATGETIAQFTFPTSEAWNSVTFTPDGTRIVALAAYHQIGVWDVTTGRLVHSLRNSRQLHHPALSPDGTRLAVALSGTRSLMLWDLRTGEEVLTIEGFEAMIDALRFTPNGRQLLVGQGGGGVVVLDGSSLLGDPMPAGTPATK